jgi:tetratricopeptide (TPR) repeat protein
VPTEEQVREIHRLAVVGAATEIAQDMGTWLSRHWLEVSRFREARDVSLQTLSLGPHATTLVNLGHAKHALGEVTEALTYFHQALPLQQEVGNRRGMATTLSNIGGVYHTTGDMQQALAYFHQALPLQHEVGDRSGMATTLSNIGGVYHATGDMPQALAYFHQALPLRHEVGDRSGESVTRYNIAMIYRAQGHLAEAVDALRQVVELDTLTQHPGLEADQAMLQQLEQAWRDTQS